MADDAFTDEQIPWHQSRPSYGRDRELLSTEELATLSACALVVGGMTTDELAAWICDLIAERTALTHTLHAAMDALNDVLARHAS